MNLLPLSMQHRVSQLNLSKASGKEDGASPAQTEAMPLPQNRDSFTWSQHPSVPEEDLPIQSTGKLSPEQVKALNEHVQKSMMSLAEKLLGNQATIAKDPNGMVDLKALAKELGMGTTPEEAAAAIGEDGMWGVDAVSTRLMDMALALSKGDSSMAGTLREAVQKGFAAVGDLKDLPKVSQDTYYETMKRFDYWEMHGTMEGYGQEEGPRPREQV